MNDYYLKGKKMLPPELLARLIKLKEENIISNETIKLFFKLNEHPNVSADLLNESLDIFINNATK